MATLVSIRWQEGGDFGAAVAAAVLPSLVSLPLLAVPILLLGTAVAFDGMLRVMSVILLVLSLAGLATLAYRKSRTATYQAARRLQSQVLASAAMAMTWNRLRQAYETLGWCRRTTTERRDPESNELLAVDEAVEFPETVLASRDYQNEVLVIIETTSTIVSAPGIAADGEKLASYLGLNGWHVEVSSASPSQVQVRIAKNGSGGDIFGRRGMPDD